MLAQSIDTAATKPLIGLTVPDLLPVGRAGLAAVKPAISVEPYAGGLGLDKRLAHGQPPVVGGMVDQPVAVENGAAPVVVAKYDDTCILAGNMRVQPSQVGIDMVRKAEEKRDCLLYTSPSPRDH